METRRADPAHTHIRRRHPHGPRLPLFLDPRWCGTRDANETFVKLASASNRDVAGTWEAVESAHNFQTVILDCYHMPSLVRYLSGQPGWALVFADNQAVIYCRRGGANEPAIRECEPRVQAERSRPDPRREADLAAQILVSLRSPRPSPLARLRFPWESFDRANLLLEMRDLPGAEAAYLDLFRHEAGSLSASRHRREILENALQMLSRSNQWEARVAICDALARSRGVGSRGGRALLLQEATGLEQLSRGNEAQRVALRVAQDPGAAADERGAAWSIVAMARESAQDYLGAIDALRSTVRDSPGDPDPYLSMATIFDFQLQRKSDALQSYAAYLSHGGRDPRAVARARELEAAPAR